MNSNLDLERYPIFLVISPRVCRIPAASSDPDVLYAIANDGSLWRRNMLEGCAWKRIIDLPQPVIPDATSMASAIVSAKACL